jgi:hypothetical protein
MVMSEQREQHGNGKAQDNFMIVSRTEDGYRAYSASQPNRQYLVSGSLDDPACTCDAFAEDRTCEHVRAVLQQFGADDRVEREERQAIQAEGQPPPTPPPKKRRRSNGAPAMMLLKRSVSPDGRIDSLSVELSCPIEQRSNADIKSRANNMLQLQSEIAKGFLNTNGKAKSNGQQNGRHGSGNSNAQAIPAKMVSIGATRNGKFFISFQANGQGAKFFGNTKQLAQAIAGAGFNYSEDDIAEGIYLNLPCRVITKPSHDGRYVNVDRVLPSLHQAQSRRGRS